MNTQIRLRNGYLQPDFDPNKKQNVFLVSFLIASVLFAIIQIYIL